MRRNYVVVIWFKASNCVQFILPLFCAKTVETEGSHLLSASKVSEIEHTLR